jgi:hypothetical protein
MTRSVWQAALAACGCAGLALLSAQPAGAREWVRQSVKDMVKGCRVTVYEDPDFSGARWTTTNGWEVVGWEFNDKISSVRVDSGIWQFYRDDHFQHEIETLYPGRYAHLKPNSDNVISSFKCARAT